jgi:hypothetical protein
MDFGKKIKYADFYNNVSNYDDLNNHIVEILQSEICINSMKISSNQLFKNDYLY